MQCAYYVQREYHSTNTDGKFSGSVHTHYSFQKEVYGLPEKVYKVFKKEEV